MLIFTPNFENNSLGRSYCLWLLVRALGWQAKIVGAVGSSVWAPLDGGDFANDCHLLAGLDDLSCQRAIDDLVVWSTVVIAVKPLPSSLGLAMAATKRVERPLIADIDDPDLEVRMAWTPFARQLKARLKTKNFAQLRQLRTALKGLPVMVSNPILQARYGGEIIPHVRQDYGQPDYSESTDIVVRFVGSVRPHKGMSALRESVAGLAGSNVRLEVTSDPPVDPKPWESWLGMTTLREGERLVATADVIALPSSDHSWANAQLPVKLIDAMMHGRPIVASNVGPMKWALGEAGLLIPADDRPALTLALTKLREAALRRQLGTAARERALEMFSIEAIAPTFATYVREVIGHDLADRGIPLSEATQPAERALVKIAVAVLTYKRPTELASLIPQLLDQLDSVNVDGHVLIVDNDPLGSGFAATVPYEGPRLRYVLETEPGIAAGRNRALNESRDFDLLVFIDDDERPTAGWLRNMLDTHDKYGGAGVVGPVTSEYLGTPDKWVRDGAFFDRLRWPTGTVIEVAATNNLLLRMAVVDRLALRFDVAFGLSGGSDTLFTRTLSRRGGRLVWCSEAGVVDLVPSDRLTLNWALRRAFRSGNTWGRTSIHLAETTAERFKVRVKLVNAGATRIAGGVGRLVVGVALRSRREQAKGLRTTARGLGMVVGAYGGVYYEYSRSTKRRG